MRKKWRDVCTHLVFIWPLFSALLPCCWKKWMESWRDKKKWAWCLRNRSGGKEGRHWMPAWRWDTRSTTVRKRFIRKDIGYTECSFFFHQKMLEEMEEALGVWQALLLPLSSDPELEVQVKCFQKALKGTKITQDILRVCGIYLHLHQFDHVFPPAALSLFFFSSSWRWFSQHLHSCPCQTCSVLWRGWVSRTKTSWDFCSAVLLNWEEGRNHRDIQFWS